VYLKVDLQRIVYALSDLLDLVGVDDAYHGKRVAWMACNLGEYLSYDEPECNALLYASLLHDCGVSSVEIRRCLVGEMEWSGSQEHCVLGAQLLASIPPLASLAPVIRHHHTRWQELKGLSLSSHLQRNANLIFLVDRVDVLATPYLDPNLLQHMGPPPAANRYSCREPVRPGTGHGLPSGFLCRCLLVNARASASPDLFGSASATVGNKRNAGICRNQAYCPPVFLGGGR